MTDSTSPSRWRGVWWMACLLVVIVQVWLFASGYRLSADDVAFVANHMDGPAVISAAAEADAKSQGRLGMYLMRPLNVEAAYHSGSFGFRLFCVGLYFGVFALLADFVTRITGSNLRSALFLLLVALNPLTFQHMPPAAYPLQNTLPMFLMLLCRILPLACPTRGKAWRFAIRAVAACVFLLCLLVSEYAIVFGLSLLCVEYGGRMLAGVKSGMHWRTSIGRALRSPSAWADIGGVLVALIAYIAFRARFPSRYDGNSLDGLADAGRFALALWRRIGSGTIFQQITLGQLSVPLGVAAAMASLGLLTGLCFYRAFSRTRLRCPGWLCVAAIFCATLVALPVSATRKYQSWCLDSQVCGFLDSRISYVWLIVALLGLLLAVAGTVPSRWRKGFTIAVSACVALTASATYAFNWRQSQAMAVIASAWERADLLACYPAKAPGSDEELSALIDPASKITFHPTIPRGAYWRRYVAGRTTDRGCPATEQALRAAYDAVFVEPRRIVAGQEVRFSEPEAAVYLASGWAPEHWGAWSLGRHSTLVFKLDHVQGDLILTLRAHRYSPSAASEPVAVSLNGQRVAMLAVSKDAQNHQVRLPSALLHRSSDGMQTIGITISDSTSPKQSRQGKDARQLGIGLVEMRLSRLVEP